MSLAAVEGLEAVVGCEQGRWPEFIQVQKMVRMEAKMNEQKPKSIIQNNSTSKHSIIQKNVFPSALMKPLAGLRARCCHQLTSDPSAPPT